MTEKGSESLPFEPPEQENIRLREENARLRRLLAVHSIPIPQLAPENRPPTKTVETAPPVDKEERARKRIALFRSLFRGREDVYAWRWKNDDGRSGYVPAAVKDWKAINKSRPEERKKVDQKTRKFLPVTDAVIENHLLGKEAVGVYPLLSDETCWFLAADFDKKTWEYDAQAFLETCQELSVPAALARSRSGKGGHTGIFHGRALSALTAHDQRISKCGRPSRSENAPRQLAHSTPGRSQGKPGRHTPKSSCRSLPRETSTFRRTGGDIRRRLPCPRGGSRRRRRSPGGTSSSS